MFKGISPEILESTNLSRDNLSGEIGRRLWDNIAKTHVPYETDSHRPPEGIPQGGSNHEEIT